MKRNLPLLAALTATLMFGFTLYATKLANSALNYDTSRYLAFRYTVGFIVMLLLVLFGVLKVSLKGKPIGLLIVIGLLNPIACQFLESTAIEFVASSLIAVLGSFTPIVTTVMSIFVNKEYPSKLQVSCMLISVSGLLIISLTGGDMQGSTFGILLIIVSILCMSGYKVLLRKGSGTCTPFEMIFFSSGVGAVGFLIMTITEHMKNGNLNQIFDGIFTIEFLPPALYMAIASTVIAFSLMAYGISKLPIVVATSMDGLGQLISIGVGVVLLNETLRTADIIGMILILGGVSVMSYGFARQAMPSSVPELPPNFPTEFEKEETDSEI